MLSGNRNFEGRVNPLTRANYLASPMLVVVYALAGSMKIDITKDPIGIGKGGKPVYLKDLWPSNMDVAKTVDKFVTAKAFKKRYANVFEGDKFWRGIKTKPQPDLRLGRQVDLRAQPALLRGHGQDAVARSATSRAPARSASSATRSPPTTSRPPARSRRTAPPATT